jgi:tetratricopeptide (TPR) repeat protein
MHAFQPFEVGSRMNTHHTSFRRALVALGLALPLLAWAQRPNAMSDGEIALLPEYCIDTQGFKYGDASFNTSPRAAYWVGLMGPSFWHHHHYCWALLKVRRALGPGVKGESRTGGLQSAIGDFDYVIRLSDPKFVMLPEVFLKMGDTYLLLGDYAMARDSYNGAARAKPDYWPAYVNWAVALEKLGKKPEALAHIGLGLRKSPNEPVLRAQYTRLGGDLAALLATVKVDTPPAERPAETASGANADPK